MLHYTHTMNKLFVTITLLFFIAPSVSGQAWRVERNMIKSPHKVNALREGEVVPIIIHETQNTTNATGTTEYYHTLIDSACYNAVRIGEYLWMNENLREKLPSVWDEPYNQASGWIGVACNHGMDINQDWLNRDMERLKIDKSQFQVNIEDFHKYYGRYYSWWDRGHFQRKKGQNYIYEDNLRVFEGKEKQRTSWRMPVNEDFRQLFAMCPVPHSQSLGQLDVRATLSYRRNENPLAYDIHDPKGGMMYRTYWFEISTNALGFNMMPGGSRLNGDGSINNGLGPNNGSWPGKRGDIYHLFHTAKYATATSQVTIHDWIDTRPVTSYHWYNVRFCRALSDEELGYKLYINKENYVENHDFVVLKLDPKTVNIIKLDLDQAPPQGFYELPKGYLRGLYVQYVLNRKQPKSIKKIVDYLKQIDDHIFFDENGQRVPYTPEPDGFDESLIDARSLLEIYPNPMVSTLYVNLIDPDAKISSIELYNFSGYQMRKVSGINQINAIDVSSLASGVYVLVVSTASGKASYKMVKQ